MSDTRDNGGKNISRRTFIKSTGGLAAGAGLAAGGVLARPATAAAKVPTKWDEEIDILILGSGFAGLARRPYRDQGRVIGHDPGENEGSRRELDHQRRRCRRGRFAQAGGRGNQGFPGSAL